MQQSDDLSPLEIVEMFAGLSCFLKDSSDVSQTLLDDFRMCQGYTFLTDLMLRYILQYIALQMLVNTYNCHIAVVKGKKSESVFIYLYLQIGAGQRG